MARPRNPRLPLPTPAQLYDGMDRTRASGQAGVGSLRAWLEADGDADGAGGVLGDAGDAARHPDGVLPDGTLRPARTRHFTSSSDAGRGTDHVRTKIPEAYAHLIGVWLAGRVVPEYQTIGDFVRDAIFHRLWDVAEGIELSAEQIERCHMEQLATEMADWEARVERNDRILQDARQTLRRLKDRPGLLRALGTMRDTALQIDQPWRGELLALIDEYED